jgi:hypothetical protein
MYVRFKLTPAQRAKASAMQAEVAKYSDVEYFLDCGVYWVDEHASTNPDQWVGLTPDGHLEVEGQRCALLYDRGIHAAMKVLAGGPHEMLRYETSDQRLRWYETLDSYMHSRASFEERWSYWQSGKGKWEVMFPHLTTVVATLRLSEARANAQYTAERIRQARVIIAREFA